ncbi:MAG: hypothetical protein R3F30_08150 [Planctomycetota bacterium]
MADQWEYTVSPKIWDTDELFTDQLNLVQRALDYEFVGAVEIEGWEHHVWRRPKRAPQAQAHQAWSDALTQLAVASGKKLNARARRFLKTLARREAGPDAGKAKAKAAKPKATKKAKKKER